jgi:hypothetical protein
MEPVKVAAVQAAPVLLDRDETIGKVAKEGRTYVIGVTSCIRSTPTRGGAEQRMKKSPRSTSRRRPR